MICVVGATTWGTTLSILLAKKNLPVNLLLRKKGEIPQLTDTPFPPSLKLTCTKEKALNKARLVILAVPTQRLRENLISISPYVNNPALVLSVAKGLGESGEPPSYIISQELNEKLSNICVLSGPNFAKEIIKGLPAVSIVAGERAEEIKELLEGSNLKLETSRDIIGVELSGALKNVIAIGAAMVEGLGYGDNAKAAFVTKGFKEIASLILACGGKLETILSYAGLGDLVLTCYSLQSRNYRFGLALAKGLTPKEALSAIPGVVEGVSTTKGAVKLSQRLGISVPIIESLYKVLFEGLNPREAIADILESI